MANATVRARAKVQYPSLARRPFEVLFGGGLEDAAAAALLWLEAAAEEEMGALAASEGLGSAFWLDAALGAAWA